MKTFIKNATVVNEGQSFKGSILIVDGIIKFIFTDSAFIENIDADEIIDASGLILMPGVIDEHVHFRDPGLTHKADLHSETAAAAAGGVTSFMDMPNTVPAATTINELEKKYEEAKEKSLINYSFYLGATNQNLNEIKKTDAENICGIKIFMGSSTGNMLVDNEKNIEKIFEQSPAPIAVHCENEAIIKNNIAYFKNKFGDKIPFEYHNKIRSSEACITSTQHAIRLAEKYKSRLHVLHISTAEETEMLAACAANKRISSETCPHYLWFCNDDYKTLKGFVKCNPSIKTQADRNALQHALSHGIINTVASDHAPHLIAEKRSSYLNCPSGLPSVQHSLNIMLELVDKNILTIEKVVECMCHNPARIFSIKNRGFIRENCKADIILVKPNTKWQADRSNILYKCAWTPFENITFNYKITHTFVNGNLVYSNGKIYENSKGERLTFERNQ
ncbi:MAG: dihydroorotase [Prevotellaceae bacterium]|jgi:dihydroorotase|nr:dihydroorotase [Prevotellaceae bacterium]